MLLYRTVTELDAALKVVEVSRRLRCEDSNLPVAEQRCELFLAFLKGELALEVALSVKGVRLGEALSVLLRDLQYDAVGGNVVIVFEFEDVTNSNELHLVFLVVNNCL